MNQIVQHYVQIVQTGPGDWKTNSVDIGSENTALGSSALAVGNDLKKQK